MTTTKGMGRSQPRPKLEEIPEWARDHRVLWMLEERGLKLEIVYDRKYLKGLCDKPLIVIRRRRLPAVIEE